MVLEIKRSNFMNILKNNLYVHFFKKVNYFYFKLIYILLGKSGLVFPQMNKYTIHMNSTLSGNTWQNFDTK